MPKKPVKLTKEQQNLLNARKAEMVVSGPSKEEMKAKRDAAKAAQEARKAAEEAEKESALAAELAEKLKIAQKYAETAVLRSQAASDKAAEEAESARKATEQRFKEEEQRKKNAMKSYKNSQKWKSSKNGQAALAVKKFGVGDNWAHSAKGRKTRKRRS